MMKTIVSINDVGDRIEFPAGFVKNSAFILQDATGVMEAKADLFTTGGALSDGVVCQGARMEQRNIVLTVRDYPGSNHALNRSTIFSHFKYKANGVLTVTNELGVKRSISYVTEAVKTDIKKRSHSYQISILCPNPYWSDPETDVTDVSSWESAFEFPIATAESETGLFEFAADSPDTDVLEYAQRSQSIIAGVENTGNVECGMVIRFTALGALSTPGILNPDTGEFIKMNLDMVAGDEMEIDTRYGHRTAVFFHAGAQTNVFRLIDPDSTFLQLMPGVNHYKAQAGSLDTNDLDITIMHDNLYHSV